MASSTYDNRVEELITGLQDARRRKDFAAIVACDDALKALLPRGELDAARQSALPDVKHPAQWISRKRRQLQRRQKRHEETVPASLQAEAIDLYPKLLKISRTGGDRRSAMVAALSLKTGLSEITISRKLRSVEKSGAAALNRKPRSDKDVRRVLSGEIEAYFRGIYTDKATRHYDLTQLIAKVREQFPECEASDSTFYRIAKTVPQAARMSDREWRARFEPTGRWEVPHRNHTWVFDCTVADLFVWDGDPGVKPYRPQLTAMLDECTRSCLFARYTKATPSVAILQTVLLHAMLPKTGDFAREWPMCGAPLHLHCDNGKIQVSDWLEDVCQTLGTELHLCGDVRHAAVQSPWQQGKIERFYGTLHRSFERPLGACYCGPNPKNKPESHLPPERGPKAWEQYPTLEALNYGLHSWLTGAYHQADNRTMKMSPLMAWVSKTNGVLQVPDEEYLRQVLLQREKGRLVRRGAVQLHNALYQHPVLQGYEGLKMEVRWDTADLTQVFIYGSDGKPICTAAREKVRNPDNPKDLAELKELRSEKRRVRKAAEQIAEEAKTQDGPTFEETVEKLRKARREAGILDFPKQQRLRPADGDDGATADEIIAVMRGEQTDGDEDEDRIIVHGLDLE